MAVLGTQRLAAASVGGFRGGGGAATAKQIDSVTFSPFFSRSQPTQEQSEVVKGAFVSAALIPLNCGKTP